MNFLSYLTLYLLLFDLDLPFFRGVGSAIFSLIISSCVLIFRYKKLKEKISFIFTEFNNILLLFSVLFAYTLLRVLFDQAEDFSYVGTSIKTFIIFVSSLCYLIVFDSKKLFHQLINVFFINASIALFVGTFQEYQSYVDIFKPNGGMELIGSTPYRNAFLSGSGYFGIGAPFGLASAFFLSYLILLKKENFLFSIWSFFKLAVIMFASIFAARTVFICFLISIMYLFLIKHNIKSLLISAIFISIGFVVINLEMFEAYHMWLFEVFDKGIEESDSGVALFSTHLKVPDNIYTFLFGDGKYVSSTGGYYMGTDIGYLRHWFFGGIFFMLMIAFIPFLMYFKNKNSLFLCVIISTSLILHFKGVFIYNNPVFTPLVMIISHILYKERYSS